MSMQHSFEEFSEKQRRVELKSVGDFVAKTVLVESANQFSLEELFVTQYSFNYFSKPCRPSDRLEKPEHPFLAMARITSAVNACYYQPHSLLGHKQNYSASFGC